MTSEAVIGAPWDTLFHAALERTEVEPIQALRGQGLADLEIEIAFYMAQEYLEGPATLAAVHSHVIQLSLNMRIGNVGITPYSNMKRLRERLEEAGFVFEGGQVLPPPTGKETTE